MNFEVGLSWKFLKLNFTLLFCVPIRIIYCKSMFYEREGFRSVLHIKKNHDFLK